MPRECRARTYVLSGRFSVVCVTVPFLSFSRALSLSPRPVRTLDLLPRLPPPPRPSVFPGPLARFRRFASPKECAGVRICAHRR